MNKHLREVRMAYGEHFLFALTLALESITMALILIIHAVFPSILKDYFTQWIDSCHVRLTKRP